MGVAILDFGQRAEAAQPRPLASWRQVSTPNAVRLRNEIVAAATTNATRAAPHLAALAAFTLPRMPNRPLASTTLHRAQASSATTALDEAITAGWVSFNTASWTNAFTVDCDHPDAVERVEAFLPFLRAEHPEAPQPMIVQDPWTGRAHVTWFLERPVYLGKQRQGTEMNSRPLRGLHDYTRRGLVMALDGDLAFTNRLTKNPFALGRCTAGNGEPAFPAVWDAYIASGSALRFHTLPGDLRPVGLLTLRRALARWETDAGRLIVLPRYRPGPADPVQGCRLFNEARARIYRLGTAEPAIIAQVVKDTAFEIGSPAGAKEIAQIARSITRFMTNRWRPGSKTGKRRGVMRLAPDSLDLPERQALGGRYAAKTRAAATDAKIARVIEQLKAAGERVTQARIAVMSRVSTRTIQKRKFSVLSGYRGEAPVE